jgi:hypothetical protein
MKKSLFATFGLPDSHAKMSRLREEARELGLKGRDLDSFMSLLTSLEKDTPELFSSKTFTVSCIRTKDETSKPLFELWPNSGILSDGVCLTAKTLESHNHAKECTLSGVIETSEVPDRYFLSPSAATGILRRANQQGRPLFPPLRKSLEILAAKDPKSKA